MDSFHLGVPLFDNCEKLNGSMVDFSVRYCRFPEFVLREEAGLSAATAVGPGGN